MQKSIVITRLKTWKIVTAVCVGILLCRATFLPAQTVHETSLQAGSRVSELHQDIQTQFTMAKLAHYEQRLARELAQMLNDPAFLETVQNSMTAESSHIPLVSLAKQFSREHPSAASRHFRNLVTTLDRQLRRAKHIDSQLHELLELRLADPSMVATFKQDIHPIVTSSPRGQEKNVSTITAFSSSGQSIALDAVQPPEYPILIVGINTQADRQAFVQLFNEELQKAGLQDAVYASKSDASLSRATVFGGRTTTLTKYYMKDDHEPWIKGKAEIYAVISGVNVARTGAYTYSVDLPNLDYDGRAYTPNTLLIYWDRFAFGVANIEFMEHDSGWDYGYILGVIGATVGGLVGGDYASVSAGWKVGEAVHQALNKLGWDLKDDDDYVDRILGIKEGWWYTSWPGISNNVRIDLLPEAQQTFANPRMQNGYRLDWCLHWGQDCGAPAANAWCSTMGYRQAAQWTIAADIGASTPTYVMGDNRSCNQTFCDGFASITCTR